MSDERCSKRQSPASGATAGSARRCGHRRAAAPRRVPLEQAHLRPGDRRRRRPHARRRPRRIEADAPQRRRPATSTAAKAVGELVGERAKAAGVDTVVFDRGGFQLPRPRRRRRRRRPRSRTGVLMSRTTAWPKASYEERVIAINRVAKVVKGGRRFSFTALVVVGDGAGQRRPRLRQGQGGARSPSRRAWRRPEEPLRGAARRLHDHPPDHRRARRRPGAAEAGRPRYRRHRRRRGPGHPRGGRHPRRAAKSLGSSNAINVARATIDGLQSLQRPDEVARLRGQVARRGRARRACCAPTASATRGPTAVDRGARDGRRSRSPRSSRRSAPSRSSAARSARSGCGRSARPTSCPTGPRSGDDRPGAAPRRGRGGRR